MPKNRKYRLKIDLELDLYNRIVPFSPKIDSIHNIAPSSGNENCFMIFSSSEENLLCKVNISQTTHSLELLFNGNAWNF